MKVSEIIIKTSFNIHEKDVLPETNALKLIFENVSIYILFDNGTVTRIIPNSDMKGHYFSISIDDYSNVSYYNENDDSYTIKSSYAEIKIKNIKDLGIKHCDIKVVPSMDKKFCCIL